MSFFHVRNSFDLKSQGITAEILEKILDIEKVSAEELLDGTIPLTKDEMKTIAKYKGISLESLISPGGKTLCI